jgi:hypothetical protein
VDLISSLANSVLVYRNVIDLCMLISYFATLLNLLIGSKSFFGRVFGVFFIKDHFLCKQSVYPIYIQF